MDPDAIFRVSLNSDVRIAADRRPAFLFRPVTGRMWKKAESLRKERHEASDPTELVDKICEMLRVGLVGWENMTDPDTGKPLPYDPAELDRLLLLREAMELVDEMLTGGQVSPDDKKKSDSSASFNPETSAAAALAPDASTRPANHCPPNSNARAAKAEAATDAATGTSH